MKKAFFSILLTLSISYLIFLQSAYAQYADTDSTSAKPIDARAEAAALFNQLPLEEKIETLIKDLYRDTVKFNPDDVMLYSSTLTNVNSYSPLFIINNLEQRYKLDIVDAACVRDFIENYLRSGKIKSIEMCDGSKYGCMTYGSMGKQGIVFMEIDGLEDIKTTQCGFRQGSNLHKWEDGKIVTALCGLANTYLKNKKD
ncbi:hypothetical protein [Chondrinema litorale]|uniref:hypothetical protein n=1 Tax=Chondrinema litorale TaxID=2994555 RepID=UPI0025430B0F|nr:hypothetical protein [Chondrinema litorale]UZR95277.1 hypothetical protein OQ292_05520 [Chondrinema litorale]